MKNVFGIVYSACAFTSHLLFFAPSYPNIICRFSFVGGCLPNTVRSIVLMSQTILPSCVPLVSFEKFFFQRGVSGKHRKLRTAVIEREYCSSGRDKFLNFQRVVNGEGWMQADDLPRI
ncbi:hypothetical protein CEXT_347581 [Caerostris extrusa]|uniref:Uncharacterized protein n=1 Tax=Caerostris extrusa TaxID=172846 RepID=A0AAV4S947_CAEEX|nr:hypothetical protein CEXT_347581 [Caerostris extrusa]